MTEIINKLPFDITKFNDAADTILKEAKDLGATEAEVYMETNKGFTVSGHGGEVETVEYHQDKVIEITVYVGKCLGAASLSDLSPKAIRDAVQAAYHIAQFTDTDPASGLADKSELAYNYPKLDLYHPWDLSVEKAIELVGECEREALRYDKRIMSAEQASISTLQVFNLYANSHGFKGSYPMTHHEISCVLVAKERDDMQRDYSYTVATMPSQLESIFTVAKQAAERSVKRLGAKRLPTMKAPVIFIAEEARGLLGHFASAIHGKNLYRKSTYLLDHLGKKVFPDFVNIVEHPHLPRALGSAPFDDDGVITRANAFVEGGVLQSYALDTYSARKLGMKTTGNAGGMHNLTISTGQHNLSELLKTMGKGFLVTELMGHGINLMTGDYSRGASGFWVEDGEIQYPVHEVTVAGKLKDIYMNIAAIGNDIDLRGNIRTGSILISEMMIAGT